jgi:hypothetical protein
MARVKSWGSARIHHRASLVSVRTVELTATVGEQVADGGLVRDVAAGVKAVARKVTDFEALVLCGTPVDWMDVERG